MKQSSIDKLSRVYNFLENEEQSAMAELIKEVLRAESQQMSCKTKFDIYKFVLPKDKYRVALQGVYYDGEYRVATDSIKLIAQKGEWPEELQGKIVKSDGSIIDGHYPNWRSLIPKDTTPYKPHKIDKAAVAAKIEAYRLEHKAEYGKSAQWCGEWRIDIDGVLFSAKHLWTLLSTGIDTLYIHEKEQDRAAIVSNDEFWGVIMPMVKE